MHLMLMHPLHTLTRTMGICASDRLRPHACRAHTCLCALPTCIYTGEVIWTTRDLTFAQEFMSTVLVTPGPDLWPLRGAVLAPPAGS